MSGSPKPSGADQAEFLRRCTFPESGTAVSCAVSGGADSLALLILASAAALRVTAIHVDHGLRDGSADEAGFVASCAKQLGATFRSETVSIEPGTNLEERARTARYRVLPADVMTGHTADDRAETMLLNLLRGAGPAGMGALRESPRRPLLQLRRTETEAVCRAAGLVPFEDPSNRDNRFRRNRVRHELLPLLADIADRDPVPILVRQSHLFADVADTLEQRGSEIDVTDAAALRAAPRVIAAQAVRIRLRDDLGHSPDQATVERVLRIAALEIRATEVGGGRRIERHGGRLSLVDPASDPADGG